MGLTNYGGAFRTEFERKTVYWPLGSEAAREPGIEAGRNQGKTEELIPEIQKIAAALRERLEAPTVARGETEVLRRKDRDEEEPG
jgi:hypothetical protein